MGWTLSIQGNYFIAEQTGAVLNVIHDYPARDIAVRKKYVDSTDYSFFHSNGGSELIIKEMSRVAFSDITAKNGEFATLEQFEEWVRSVTGWVIAPVSFDDSNIVNELIDLKALVVDFNNDNSLENSDILSRLDLLISEAQQNNIDNAFIKSELTNIKDQLIISNGHLSDVKLKLDDLLLKVDTIISKIDILISEVDDVEELLTDIETNTSLASGNNHFDIPQSNTSVLLVASNANRKELIIRNDSQGNQKLYIGFNDPSTLNNAIFLSKDEIYIEDKYTGSVYGVWDGAGNGFARIEEKVL